MSQVNFDEILYWVNINYDKENEKENQSKAPKDSPCGDHAGWTKKIQTEVQAEKEIFSVASGGSERIEIDEVKIKINEAEIRGV